MKKLLLAAALTSALSAQAFAAPNLIVNGDFEQNAGVPNGGFTKYAAGSTGITGWTIGLTSVDLIKNAYGSINGVSVDMLGTPGPGSLSQSFATTAGWMYSLSFDLGANRGGDNSAVGKLLNVAIDGTQIGSFIGDYTKGSVVHETLTFKATSNLTTLSFASPNYGYSGPVLDNVAVTAVPEPETYAMFLAGLGLMGTIARRRKQA